MARKKSRPATPSSRGTRVGSETAVVAPPLVPSNPPSPLTAAAPSAPLAPTPAPREKRTLGDKSWVEIQLLRLVRHLGSLQLAVISLSIFVVVMAIGTMVESWYSGRLAQELVYRAWWFSLLLGVLGVNIFSAAAKKWPWKKHQTGFIVTHVGLILMVVGGLFNALGGTDAQLVLVDSHDPEIQKQGGAPQANTRMTDRDTALITVQYEHDGKTETQRTPFNSGSLLWYSDKYLQGNFDPLLGTLAVIAHPLPYGWKQTLPTGAELEVENFYPNSKEEPFQKAEDADEKHSFPALKYTLSSPMAGTFPEQWLAMNMTDQTREMGPGMTELLGLVTPAVLSEFQNPPPAAKLGKRGQLVLVLGGEKYRFAVDDLLDENHPKAAGRYKVWVKRYTANVLNPDDPEPQYPALEVKVTAPEGGEWTFKTLARFTGPPVFPDEKRNPPPPDLAEMQVWYHPPDYRYGKSRVWGVLQFALAQDGKLHYRSFRSNRGEDFHFEQSGEATRGGTYPMWSGMNWKFQVSEFLPRATNADRPTPINLRPGSEREDAPPAIRCRLRDGKEEKEFWLAETTGSLKKVQVGGKTYRVGYHVKTSDMGCEIKLLRAEQPVDPGTNQAAGYSSWVQLTDKEQNILDQDQYITMNAPLEHRGYKFYQSGYQLLGVNPGNQRPISRSVFTVSYDPGIWLKYIGSTMLALGIACMFYMKAYFFKPRGRQATGQPSTEA
jgi:hypothetical protein